MSMKETRLVEKCLWNGRNGNKETKEDVKCTTEKCIWVERGQKRAGETNFEGQNSRDSWKKKPRIYIKPLKCLSAKSTELSASFEIKKVKELLSNYLTR